MLLCDSGDWWNELSQHDYLTTRPRESAYYLPQGAQALPRLCSGTLGLGKLRLRSGLLSLSPGKSGYCLRPETKTEPALEKKLYRVYRYSSAAYHTAFINQQANHRSHSTTSGTSRALVAEKVCQIQLALISVEHVGT